MTLEVLSSISVNPVHRLHVIGGGSRNKLLNQFTSNAIGLPVIAGPAEATAIGNIMMQAKASGSVNSLHEMRYIISNSIELDKFARRQREVGERI